MRESGRVRRKEMFWWSGVVLWGIVILLWHPPPPTSFARVPSVSKNPPGYRVFFELVKRQTGNAMRTVVAADKTGREPGVRVLLSPSRPLGKSRQEALWAFVEKRGGTVVLGHPIRATGPGPFARNAEKGIAAWEALPGTRPHRVFVSYQRRTSDARDVPSFDSRVRGQLRPVEDRTAIVASDEQGRVMATVDTVGKGRVFQLASASFLDNTHLGYQRSHLFAAALLDEVGREQQWVFDESNEGVSVQPPLMSLVGSGSLRHAFVYVVLLGMFVYWWRSARMGKEHLVDTRTGLRRVGAMAQDIGGLYLRGRKGEWALRHYLDWYDRDLQYRSLVGPVAHECDRLGREARMLLDTRVSVKAATRMIRKMSRQLQRLQDREKDAQ